MTAPGGAQNGRSAAMLRCYWRGHEAAVKGGAAEDNPYLVAMNRDAWAQGYDAGLAWLEAAPHSRPPVTAFEALHGGRAAERAA